jgi:hypothetical protein
MPPPLTQAYGIDTSITLQFHYGISKAVAREAIYQMLINGWLLL